MTDILLIILIVLVLLTIIILFLKKPQDISEKVEDIVEKKNRDLYRNLSNSQQMLNNHIGERIDDFNKSISEKQELMRNSVVNSIIQQEQRFKTFSLENSQQLEQIRGTVRESLSSIQNDNNKRLDEMKGIVDEKLQKSIENKMNESFRLVSERLEQVYKGLGEMNTLAKGVGDLKKVLSGVKTRGILGEIQLGAILREILSPEQYEENVAVKPKSREVVEFAVKLPGDDSGFVYLPIDSKFPGDTYQALLDAYDSGDKNLINDCAANLIKVVTNEAKDIATKYIAPPYTTNFAILFLPFEGLYAEVVNRGMVEKLQKMYRVNIAGPSTMAALLNSLQMGFSTLAIRERSAEIEKVLQAVKTEFDKFDTVLLAAQKKLDGANNDLDKLIGTRTRMIKSKLKNVSKLENENEVRTLLGVDYEE